MAHEILSGSYDVEVDCWSLGISAYLLIVGALPYKATERAKLFEEIGSDGKASYPLPAEVTASEACRDFVERLLTKDSFQRLRTGGLLSHPFIACKRRCISCCVFSGKLSVYSEVLEGLVFAERFFEPEVLADSDNVTWGSVLGDLCSPAIEDDESECGLASVFVVSSGHFYSLNDSFPCDDKDITCFVISRQSLCKLSSSSSPLTGLPFFEDTPAELAVLNAGNVPIGKTDAAAMDAYSKRHAKFFHRAHTFRTLVLEARRSLVSYIKTLFSLLSKAERLAAAVAVVMTEDNNEVEECFCYDNDNEEENKDNRRCNELVQTFCSAGYEAMYDASLRKAFVSGSPTPSVDVDKKMRSSVSLFCKAFLAKDFARSELVELPLLCWNVLCERGLLASLVRFDLPRDFPALCAAGALDSALAELRKASDAVMGAKDDLKKIGVYVCKKRFTLVEKSCDNESGCNDYCCWWKTQWDRWCPQDGLLSQKQSPPVYSKADYAPPTLE